MRTYYIVEGRSSTNKQRWTAHRRGILSTLNMFNINNEVIWSGSTVSADDCEKNLRDRLASKKFKPKVVRVVRA